MPIRLKPLAGQVVVITGASSGIGLVTARAAAEAGAKVMLIARNEAALASIVDDITAAGGTADFAVADVGDRAQLEAAAARTVARFGRIDTWVSNAGVTIYAKLLETPPDEHERMMRTNYFGAVNSAAVAIPRLREAGGAFIVVASIAADIPSPVMGAYAATKHAVKGFVGSLRIELLADGVPVSVTLIKPSGINTPIGAHAANHGYGSHRGEAMIPPPVYQPEIVARAILDACVHPRREVTVGGAGRAQTLFAEHFPALLDRFAPLLIPLLFDPNRKATPTDGLSAPARDGAAYSATKGGRSFSSYTAAARHPLGLLGLGLAVAVTGAMALGRKRH